MFRNAVIPRKNLGGGGGAFTPLDLPNLVAWYKADSLLLTNGDPVSTWVDSSGNGHDMTQTGSNRPTYETNIQNSLPGVKFVPGSSQYLTTANIPGLEGITGCTFYMVFKKRTTGVAFPVFSQDNPSTGEGFCFLAQTDDNLYAIITDGALQYFYYADGATSPSYWTGLFDGSQAGNARYLTYKAGSSQSLTYNETPPATTPTGAGLSLELGRRNIFSTVYADGHLFEFAICSAAHNSTNRGNMESYLASRWGL